MTVATFKDKGEAARRMARLKRSHPGARYELRRVRRAAHRLFESRSHRRSVTSRRDPSAVWTVSLQVTSPSRPNLRHQLEYTVRASDREDAVEKAKRASRRDGNTVVGVVAVHKRGRRTGR
jgi:hypothetical protein